MLQEYTPWTSVSLRPRTSAFVYPALPQRSIRIQWPLGQQPYPILQPIVGTFIPIRQQSAAYSCSNNHSFKLLNSLNWKEKEWSGPRQFMNDELGNGRNYHIPCTGTSQTHPLTHFDPELMMLPTDMALMDDPKFRPWVEKYAKDKDLFFDDFAKVFEKLMGECKNVQVRSRDQRCVLIQSNLQNWAWIEARTGTSPHPRSLTNPALLELGKMARLNLSPRKTARRNRRSRRNFKLVRPLVVL